MSSGGNFLKMVLVSLFLLAGCAEKNSDSKELSADVQAKVCETRSEQSCGDSLCQPIFGVNAATVQKEYLGCMEASACNEAITCVAPKGYATPRFVLSSGCKPLNYEVSHCSSSDMPSFEDHYGNESSPAL